MRRLSIFILLLIFANLHLCAQEQWATRIIKYSSQAGSKQFAAKQALGSPNALHYGKNPVAWAPQAPNVGIEYLEVAFDYPMQVEQVAISESFNPGAIYEIHLIERNGKSHKVFEQSNPKKAGSSARIFRYMMKRTSYEVTGLKLVINTAAVYGLNQIDAIGISSSSKPMNVRIHNPSSVNFIGDPENLGYNVNSEDPDLLPLISLDGKNLYFARKFHKDNLGDEKNDDIYTAKRNDKGGWTEAVNIGAPLNNTYNNFVCAVNPDGTELLLSGRYRLNDVLKEGLYKTKLRNGKWSAPKPIFIEGYRNLSPFVCYHVSPDMRYLLIAMEDPDTYGDMDIYVSMRKSEGRYSKPVNLGPVINTAGTEPSVFLSADGKTIYFASDGHPGYGAYDMFMSRRLDNSWKSWSEPVNLGPQINSKDWDLYFTVPASGEYAYYSSEHKSYGKSDVFRIKLPDDVRPEPVSIITPSFVNLKPGTQTADISQSKKTIILQDDSKVGLYEEIKGFYPVNDTEDLSGELEEEDDFGQINSAKPDRKDQEMDAKMEDLLARLQELKNEQAKTDNAFEKVIQPSPEVRKPAATTTSVQPQVGYSNELDEKLAALRSEMDKISSGNKPQPLPKEQQVTGQIEPEAPTKKEIDVMEDEQAYTDQLEDYLQKRKEQEEALEEFGNKESGQIVSPKSAEPEYYELKESEEDEFREDYMSYRDRLEELKMKKSEAVVATQPLTKYALQRTAIDEEMERELVASTLESELNDLKENNTLNTEIHPEVEAYVKKLEELQKEKDITDIPADMKPTTSSESDKVAITPQTDTDEPDDESVLAFQKKLDEMKARMDNLPSAYQEKPANSAESGNEDLKPETAPVESTKEEEDGPVVHDIENAKVKRDNRKRQEEIADVPAAIVNPPEPDLQEVTGEPNVSDENDAPDEVVAIGNDVKDDESDVEKTLVETEVLPIADNEEIAAVLSEEIRQLSEEAEDARMANEAAKLENERLQRERLEIEEQKRELQDIIALLEEERMMFLDEQTKLESDRKKLEELRLEQHKEVKKLENEINALQQQKGVVVEETSNARPVNDLVIDTEREIFLMPVEAGVTVEIRNVFFGANSTFIKPRSYIELDKVAVFLEVNNNITVEIGGHTNGLCDDKFCNQLSEKRAMAVSDYITAKGIAADRLTYKGYGREHPIADNKTEEGRKKNQRVELKIISVD